MKRTCSRILTVLVVLQAWICSEFAAHWSWGWRVFAGTTLLTLIWALVDEEHRLATELGDFGTTGTPEERWQYVRDWAARRIRVEPHELIDPLKGVRASDWLKEIDEP